MTATQLGSLDMTQKQFNAKLNDIATLRRTFAGVIEGQVPAVRRPVCPQYCTQSFHFVVFCSCHQSLLCSAIRSLARNTSGQ